MFYFANQLTPGEWMGLTIVVAIFAFILGRMFR